MAFVRQTNWDEENPDPRPAPRTAGPAYAPSGSSANWAPAASPAASGMPDLLSYVRANGDQVNAASEKTAKDLETRARDAIDTATNGKDYQPGTDPTPPGPSGGFVPKNRDGIGTKPGTPGTPGTPASGTPPDPGDAESVLMDLDGTGSAAGRESLSDAGTKGGRALDSYMFGQAGMGPIDQVRSMYGDLLRNARPPSAATPPAEAPGPTPAFTPGGRPPGEAQPGNVTELPVIRHKLDPRSWW